MTRAVVFAYHNVGVRCLKVLLAHGVEVPLVVTHRDNPRENIWFDSVAKLAQTHGIEVIMPDDPNVPQVVAQVAAHQADFLFSFYYRHMLRRELLLAVSNGAYNMHGSLLPKYRGRVPVNWAIIHGETETGATLHAMTEKPDNGAIVMQKAVPIGLDDTAPDVFMHVTAAAAAALDAVLPALLAGTAPHLPQDLSKGSYFGGRGPEDGRIDFTWPAKRIHDFVRALTRPYPGAFADVGGRRLGFWRTHLQDKPPLAPAAHARLAVAGSEVVLVGSDGGALTVTDFDADGAPVSARSFVAIFGGTTIDLA